jgi:4-amino-4-deoxy-L-arabinose transferase-like glycosyltransferase
VIFAFVLILFLTTRVYRIAQIPQSLYWDEASIGYNAFAVATDLKDEWGEKLPLHFRAFGEFKLPVYIYTVAVFVKAIGLNEYAVRLPAVLYSLGTLIVVYLLTKKITGGEGVAILASFILSVSPWFFIFSRTGYEATAGLFFFLLAIYLFIFGVDKKPGVNKKLLFFFGVTFLIASIYSYTVYRLLSLPVLLFFTILTLQKGFRKELPVVLFSLLFFVVSLIPIVRLFIYDAGFGRAQGFALIPGFRQVYDLAGKPRFQITFNRTEGINWWQNVATMGRNYFSHFSPNFLFLSGDGNPRSQIPGHGQLYMFEIPLVLLGLFAVVKRKKILYYLPLALLLIAPIPAALTKESPHALRALLAAPAFAMISALGVYYLRENVKKLSMIVLVVIIAAYYLFFENYVVDFATKYSSETSSDWQYQYKEIFANQKSGVVTDKYGQPYIFALYYLKYHPSKFREDVKYNPVENWGFSTVKSFNGFEFTDK